MYCCGAGTAADTEMTTQTVASQLELQRLHTGRTVPVETAATLLKRMLFRYQGHIGAALVLGGVDRTGPHIYCIYPHGSVDKLPYATMGKQANIQQTTLSLIFKKKRKNQNVGNIKVLLLGSGSLAAMAVFESNWKPNMSEEEGKKLVRDAIAAGIFNDLGSGSNVDLCVIRNSGPAQYLRTYEEANVKVYVYLDFRTL